MCSCGGIIGAKRSSAASIAARFGMLARFLLKSTYLCMMTRTQIGGTCAAIGNRSRRLLLKCYEYRAVSGALSKRVAKLAG
jgi:hypothetical protein